MKNRHVHPAQVANDLDVLAHAFNNTGHDNLVGSLRRGAATIRDLIKIRDELEAAAEEEALMFEKYRQGAEVRY